MVRHTNARPPRRSLRCWPKPAVASGAWRLKSIAKSCRAAVMYSMNCARAIASRLSRRLGEAERLRDGGDIACEAERPQQDAGLLGEARMAEPSNGVPSRRERVKPDAKLMFVLRRFFRGSGNERISHVLQFSFRMHP